jgi:hypothetical protein
VEGGGRVAKIPVCEGADVAEIKGPHATHRSFPNIVTSVDVHLVINDETAVVSASFWLFTLDSKLVPIDVLVLLMIKCIDFEFLLSLVAVLLLLTGRDTDLVVVFSSTHIK